MPSQIELGVPRKDKPKGPDEKGDSFDLFGFLKEVKTEFKKISWPTQEQVTKEFLAVLVLVTVLTSIIYVLDIIFGFTSDFFMGNI